MSAVPPLIAILHSLRSSPLIVSTNPVRPSRAMPAPRPGPGLSKRRAWLLRALLAVFLGVPLFAASKASFVILAAYGEGTSAQPNTLPALLQSAKFSDHVWIEIRETLDGHLVAVGSEFRNRLSAEGGSVEMSRLEALREFERRVFPETLPGHRVATLGELFAALPPKKPLWLFRKSGSVMALRRELAAVKGRSGIQIAADSPAFLKALNTGLPGYDLGLILDTAWDEQLLVQMKMAGVKTLLVPRFEASNQGSLTIMKRVKMRVIAMWVDRVDEAYNMAKGGVDGVLTSTPSMLVAVRDQW